MRLINDHHLKLLFLESVDQELGGSCHAKKTIAQQRDLGIANVANNGHIGVKVTVQFEQCFQLMEHISVIS